MVDHDSPTVPGTTFWKIEAWRWFPVSIGGVMLAAASLIAQAPAVAIIGLSVAGMLLLCYGLRLWWFPVTVIAPHIAAAAVLAYVWALGSNGALLGFSIALHLAAAAAVVVALFAGPRAWLVVYVLPAIGVGVAAVQCIDFLILRGSPLGIASAAAFMAVQAVAISLVLWRVTYAGLALFWTLVLLVVMTLNGREWLHRQSELMSMREHLERTAGEVPGLTDGALRADGITWGREDAAVQLVYVMSLDGDLAQSATQLQSLLALQPEVMAGRLRIQCDVTCTQGHALPMLVQLSWDGLRSDRDAEEAGRVMLERLSKLRPDTINNMALTFIGSLESERPGRRAAMDLAVTAPALLDRLDRQALTHRSLGMTGIPMLIVARSTGAGRKPAILLRSTDPVATSALRSHL